MAYTKHGLSDTPTYKTWKAMLARCTDPTHDSYEHYGAKGITVCDHWHDLTNFVADMGLRPKGTTIDRIDTTGNYEPGNCRWATQREQARNTTQSVIITFDGKTMNAIDWAAHLGISRTVLWWRLQNWSLERALTEPAAPRRTQATKWINIPPDQWPIIVAKRQAGAPLKDLAAEYGVSKTAIHNGLKRFIAGPPRRRRC